MTIGRIIDLLKIEKECILRNINKECNRQCSVCDLVQEDIELNEMYTEAICILESQEPRILEIYELTSWDGIMYIECKGLEPIAAEFDSYRSMYSFSVLRYDEPWEQLASQYGKTWRCWNTKPTDEQRKETRWND